jgi:hypothetical protein
LNDSRVSRTPITSAQVTRWLLKALNLVNYPMLKVCHKLLELERANEDLSEILRAIAKFPELSELTKMEKQGLKQRTNSEGGKPSFLVHEAHGPTYVSSPNSEELWEM